MTTPIADTPLHTEMEGSLVQRRVEIKARILGSSPGIRGASLAADWSAAAMLLLAVPMIVLGLWIPGSLDGLLSRAAQAVLGGGSP